ncbi:EthD domain-containing protein [Xylariales sp. AK1849]|nr:EthD domain-containing protein [Xylariales sp. AK1849]
MTTFTELHVPEPVGPTKDRYLCLTICGYRKPGMSEGDYRHHMVDVSAPMTKGLMVKYGIERWTQVHNQTSTRALMAQLFDPQMANVADFDCFSQVIFKDIEDYKRFKQDSWYKEKLINDHENFADTKRSMMTIGWVEEFIRDGAVVNGFGARAQAVTTNRQWGAGWLFPLTVISVAYFVISRQLSK